MDQVILSLKALGFRRAADMVAEQAVIMGLWGRSDQRPTSTYIANIEARPWWGDAEERFPELMSGLGEIEGKGKLKREVWDYVKSVGSPEKGENNHSDLNQQPCTVLRCMLTLYACRTALQDEGEGITSAGGVWKEIGA